MPNFDVRITDGAAVTRWVDPPTAELPSRINPAPNRPHLYWRGAVGEQVELSAVVEGVVGPLDSALAGATFCGWFAEFPAASPPSVSSPAGKTSVVRFTPMRAGHYTYVMRRRRGGGMVVHLDAV